MNWSLKVPKSSMIWVYIPVKNHDKMTSSIQFLGTTTNQLVLFFQRHKFSVLMPWRPLNMIRTDWGDHFMCSKDMQKIFLIISSERKGIRLKAFVWFSIRIHQIDCHWNLFHSWSKQNKQMRKLYFILLEDIKVI